MPDGPEGSQSADSRVPLAPSSTLAGLGPASELVGVGLEQGDALCASSLPEATTKASLRSDFVAPGSGGDVVLARCFRLAAVLGFDARALWPDLAAGLR